MPFGNPVMAGKYLARQVMQSLNFVPNTSGWQVDRNGNAQFNNVTITGTFTGPNIVINGNGAFFYNTGQTELIASVCGAACRDPVLNALCGSGISIFGAGSNLAGTIAGGGLPGYPMQLDGNVEVVGVTNSLVSTTGTHGNPSVITTDSWHNLAIPSGWTDSSGNGTGFSYRLQADGNLLLNVDMTAPASAPPNGTQIATLPAGYFNPNTLMNAVLSSNTTVSGGQSPHFSVDTSGDVFCWGIAGSAIITGTPTLRLA